MRWQRFSAHMTDEKYMGGGEKKSRWSVCEVAEGMFSHRNTLNLLCGFAERRKLSLGEQGSPTLLLTRWEQIWKKKVERISLIKRSRDASKARFSVEVGSLV
jgi:hypothetical protein